MAPEPSTVARRSTRPPKGEGQWALGYTEPLNPNERFNKDDDGLNVRARIENVYSRNGFASIDPSDLRGRMCWWGLYTQRRPGIDGGRTASLEPHELDDEYFMLRVRSDGALLTPDQLRAIADVSQTYARDPADITDRQNVQLHWIRIEDVPAIWQRLESVGLSTNEARGDTPTRRARLSGGRRRGRRDHRRHARGPRDRAPLHRRPSLLEPAAQVQVRSVRLAAPRRRPRDQRRLVRRRGPPRARPRFRRLGRRWPVDQPDALSAARGARAVEPPAVVVVGDVVAMRTQLGAFAPERP